jgi:hypothetical protein
VKANISVRGLQALRFGTYKLFGVSRVTNDSENPPVKLDLAEKGK